MTFDDAQIDYDNHKDPYWDEDELNEFIEEIYDVDESDDYR